MANDNTGNLGGAFRWLFQVMDETSGPLKNMRDSYRELGKAVGETVGAFKRGIADMQQSYSSFTSKISSVVGAAADLQDIYLGLGINVERGSAEMRNAYKVMSTLEWQLGLTADEAKALVNQGQDFKLLGKDMRNWAIYSTEYAKATGQAVSSTGDLFFQMHKLYGIGTAQLRGIGAAMKFIGDKTAISHDELSSFMKSMDAYFVRLPSQSKSLRARMTVDVAAIAGLFRDEMGDPAKLTDVFSKMLDPTSPEGHQMASVMGMFGEMSMEQVMEGMKTNPAMVIAKFSEGLSKISRRDLEMQAPFLSQVFGFTFQDLRAFQKMAKSAGGTAEGIMGFIKKARAEFEKEQRAKNKAAEVTNWYRVQQEKFRRTMLRLWATIGRPLRRFVMEFMKPVITSIQKLAGVMNEEGKPLAATFGELGTKVGEVVGKFIEFSAKVIKEIPWKWLVDNVEKIGLLFVAWKVGSLATDLSAAAKVMGAGATTSVGGFAAGAVGSLSWLMGAGAAALAGWTIGSWLDQLDVGGRKVRVIISEMLGAKSMGAEALKVQFGEYEEQARLRRKGGIGVQTFGEFIRPQEQFLSKGQLFLVRAAKALEDRYLRDDLSGTVRAQKALKWFRATTGGDEETTGVKWLMAYGKELREAHDIRKSRMGGGMSLPPQKGMPVGTAYLRVPPLSESRATSDLKDATLLVVGAVQEGNAERIQQGKKPPVRIPSPSEVATEGAFAQP